MTIFLRLLDVPVDEKQKALLGCVRKLEGARIFEREPKNFAEVPGSPFAYWVSESVRDIFREFTSFENSGRLACRTNSVDNDFRYVRSWWEVERSHSERWRSWAKGGSYSRWYYDIDTVIVWDSVRCTYTGFLGTDNRPLQRPASVQHFFRPGLSWPRRTTSGLGLRAMPRGCIFGDKGPAAFVPGDTPVLLLGLASIMNSAIFGYLVSVQVAAADAAARSYEVGLIQQTPVPNLSYEDNKELERLARRAWSLKRNLDTPNETSHAFLLPPGLNEKVTGLDRVAIEKELSTIQREIDDRAFELYGIGPEDRATIEASGKSAASSEEFTDDEDDEDASDDNAAGISENGKISWFVGVAFGRFDPRLATGERAVPPEPEPFDPLPARSPGMWPEGEQPKAPPPDLLVDDPGHKDDICTHVANAMARVGSPEPHDLRAWLGKEFFPLHVKMYSKSRRKAPIYWQLATPSASFSAWLYLHAFTKDTFFKLQNDYVAPKVAHEERKLEALRRELGEGAKAKKALAAQETFVEELRGFLDEVKRIAPLWNPDLDDGVIINFAPLWRLVPHHKPWQKELRATWDALCAGEYDWSHLAMHLWPERVVPKCATDRSLAIAHGLEEVFWFEGDDGKWKARKAPQRPVEEIVEERSSAAVKAALKSLLDAPTASAGKTSARSRGAR